MVIVLKPGEFFPPEYDGYPGYTHYPPKSIATNISPSRGGPWRANHVNRDGHLVDGSRLWIVYPDHLYKPKFNEWGEDGL